MAMSFDPLDMGHKDPIEYAIDRWLMLSDSNYRDFEPDAANPVMVTLPLHQLKMLQMELNAFKAGYRQGRVK